MNRVSSIRTVMLVMTVTACAPDSPLAPAIVRSRIDGSPLDGAVLQRLRANPRGCIVFRTNQGEVEFAVVTNKDLGGTLTGSVRGDPLHEVSLRLQSAEFGVLAADCLIDVSMSASDLALRWAPDTHGGHALAAAFSKLSWHSVRSLRKSLEGREIRHEVMGEAVAVPKLALAPVIVIGYKDPPSLSDRESAAYDDYCNTYDYYDGEHREMTEFETGGDDAGGTVGPTTPTDTTTTEDSSAVCDPKITPACLDTLQTDDKLLIDSSLTMFDTTSGALCKEAYDSVQAFLSSGRVFRGQDRLLDGHHGYTSAGGDTIHIDGNYLDGVRGPSYLLELLLHEGFHTMNKDHPKNEGYPYTTEPFNLPTSGNPPCVSRP